MSLVGTSERNGRKRKERKNACGGEPHDGEERKWEESGGEREWEGEGEGIRKKKDWKLAGAGGGLSAAAVTLFLVNVHTHTNLRSHDRVT